jgi:hypothetical protein
MSAKSKSEYRRLIRPVIQGEPADSLRGVGFTGSSLSFSRSCDNIDQKVEFDILVRPPYAKDSAQLVLSTHILPTAAIGVYEEMVPGDDNPSDACRISAPLESISQKRVSMWFFKDETSAAMLESSIVRVVVDSVIPYMDTASSLGGVFEICREGVCKASSFLGYSAGSRAALGAAIAILIGDVPAAIDIAETAYSNSSTLRSQYGSVFSYLNDISSH